MKLPEAVQDAVVAILFERMRVDPYAPEHYYAAVGPVEHAERYGIDRWPGVRWCVVADGWQVAFGDAEPIRRHLARGTEAWQLAVLHALKPEFTVVPVVVVNDKGLGVGRVTLRPVPEGGSA